MTDENDADVDRALAAFGGSTMKYLNFASPLLKRAARTPSLTQTSLAAEPSYEPLFKRAPSVPPAIAPVPEGFQCEPPSVTAASPASMTDEAIVLAPEEPAAELQSSPAATSTGASVASEPMPEQPAEPQSPVEAAPVAVAIASIQLSPSPLVPLADEVLDASGTSVTAGPAPFTSLADHMSRVFGGAAEREPVGAAVPPNPATDQADTSAPDRRTIAEMFRILSGSERLGHTVEVAPWQDIEQSLFRRL